MHIFFAYINRVKVSSASSQTEIQVDGAVLSDVVLGQQTAHHLPAFMNEPLLAHLDPLPALDLGLEVVHSLLGFDVVCARLSPIVSEEHLDGSGLGHQQRHPGARM